MTDAVQTVTAAVVFAYAMLIVLVYMLLKKLETLMLAIAGKKTWDDHVADALSIQDPITE